MAKYVKLIEQILSGKADANILFDDLCNLLIRYGFEMRVSGSHHLFRKPGISEKINLQKDNHKAKPYQVKQVRNIILKYNNQNPAISHLKRISKPGLRVYAKSAEIPRVLGGLGTVIISTPRGVMDGQTAKSKKLGGELICEVY